ncbi:MAG: N-formylglutamate amidohydrolase [Desulfofustis sp.]|jgi:hypothetical protein|nr:N-formylglutamate amidohydrolase [Desulfofustis sp.]
MDVLTEAEIIKRIAAGKRFRATVAGGAYSVAIARYVPALVTAIHDGHDIPAELAGDLLVSEEQRRFEEDPFTGAIADSFAISLTVHHSRYFYDINRRPEQCIYQEAWGQIVRKRLPPERQKRQILDLHRSYYRVLDAVIGALEQRFSGYVVYDLHSYNYSRLPGDPPLFNVGTHFVDRDRFRPLLDLLLDGLSAIEVPEVVNRTAVDEVFAGKGYQAEYLSNNHPGGLCLPIEIKKVFMDEATGSVHDDRFRLLREGLCRVLATHAGACAEHFRIDSCTPADFLRPGGNS